jgi:transposase-like protein
MFTKIIHDKGYTVKEACKLWGIRYDVWRRKCRNPKLREQLIHMCQGLKPKEAQEELSKDICKESIKAIDNDERYSYKSKEDKE